MKNEKGKMSIMQFLKSKGKTILSKLPFQSWILGKKRDSFFFRQKNSQLETKNRRRLISGNSNEIIERIWNAIYERGKMESLLRSRLRTKENQRDAGNEKSNEKGSNQAASEEEKRKKHLTKLEMAKMFQSVPFKFFLEELKKMEEFSFSELITPLAKPENTSYNEYTWYRRGELNVFLRIRDIIEQIIKYQSKNALSNH